MTAQLESFIARFTDGSVKRVRVKEPESGFYRENDVVVGDKVPFRTYECFIAGGVVEEIQGPKEKKK